MKTVPKKQYNRLQDELLEKRKESITNQRILHKLYWFEQNQITGNGLLQIKFCFATTINNRAALSKLPIVSTRGIQGCFS